MATAQDYAQWIERNADKKGTPDFEEVANAFRAARGVTAVTAKPPIAAAPPQAIESPEPTSAIYGDLKIDPAVTGQLIGNVAAGAVRGAGSIGATLLAPYDIAKDALNGKGLSLESNRARRAGIDQGLELMGAQPGSGAYQTGKLASEVAGTAGMGGVLAKGAAMIPKIPASLVESLRTGGMRVAGKTGANALFQRVAGGAATGAASAGAVDPELAKTGAVIGGALPGSMQVAGMAGRAIGKVAAGTGGLPEVKALASRAKELGIDIPADRIANSQPLNALASSLNYVPMSGRAGTEQRMINQVKTAVSRTFGESTDNITQGLRSAHEKLGGEFERVLSTHNIALDKPFLDDLARHTTQTMDELGKSTESQVILKQIKRIKEMGKSGTIGGQAAYNIKKTLDRIGKKTTPDAHYAIDVKRSLMEALNRSLPAEEAAGFALTRQRYGNMLEIDKLAQNGAEGDISIARLAGLPHLNNPDLKEIADITSQFIKAREGAHGSAQRVFLGGASVATPATWPYLAAGIAAGRTTNALLNSNAMRNLVTGTTSGAPRIGNALTKVLPLAYQGGQLSR